MSHFFSQRLAVHFILSLVQTQRTTQCSDLGAWCAQALAVAYDVLDPRAPEVLLWNACLCSLSCIPA